MANFVVTKVSDATAVGVFSNLKNAVDCLLKMGVKTNYDYIYRKMKASNGGAFLDFEDLRIAKLLQNNVYQYQNGKLINEFRIKDE